MLQQSPNVKDEYLNFLEENGISVQLVEFPYYFQHQLQDIKGVLAKNDFTQNDVLMAIPDKAVISVFTVSEDPRCSKIMDQNPDLFLSDFNALLLYLVYERNGKWKRVFDYTPNPCSLEDCPEQLLGNNIYLKSQLKEYREYRLQEKKEFMEVVKDIDESLYDWAYKYVMNRRLSISHSYPFTFLVPFIDMINHGEDKVRFGLIKLEYEKEKPKFYENNNPNLKKLMGVECEEQKDQQISQMNQQRMSYIQLYIGLLDEEDRNEVKKIKVLENDRVRRLLDRYLVKINLKLFQLDGNIMLWNLIDFREKYENDEDDMVSVEKSSKGKQEQKKSKGKQNSQPMEAAVNDDYIKNFYQMEEDEQENEVEEVEEESGVEGSQLNYELLSQLFVVHEREREGGCVLHRAGVLGHREGVAGAKPLRAVHERAPADLLRVRADGERVREGQVSDPHAGEERGRLGVEREEHGVPGLVSVSKEQQNNRLIEYYGGPKPQLLEFEEFTTEFKLCKHYIDLELVKFLRTYFHSLEVNDFERRVCVEAASLQGELIVINLYIQILERLREFWFYEKECVEELLRVLGCQEALDEEEAWVYKLAVYRWGKIEIVDAQMRMLEVVQQVLVQTEDVGDLKASQLEVVQQADAQEDAFEELVRCNLYFKDVYDSLAK